MRVHARVPAHEILANEPTTVPDGVFGDDEPTETATNTRRFELDQHWLRGGYAPSLFADNDEASYRWRAGFLRLDLPPLPADRRGSPIDPERFWPLLARDQGGQGFKVQRHLGLDNATFEDCLHRAETAQLLRRLPAWPSPRSDGRPRLYLRDSGLLHRLLNVESLQLLGERAGASWEGFAIEALIGAAPPDAGAWVYRDADTDEIDLVLRSPRQAQPWAVEIKSSHRARLSAGFYRGAEAINAARRVAVHRGASRVSSGPEVEALSLVDVMRDLQRL